MACPALRAAFGLAMAIACLMAIAALPARADGGYLDALIRSRSTQERFQTGDDIYIHQKILRSGSLPQPIDPADFPRARRLHVLTESTAPLLRQSGPGGGVSGHAGYRLREIESSFRARGPISGRDLDINPIRVDRPASTSLTVRSRTSTEAIDAR
jgi:hypothetical protein